MSQDPLILPRRRLLAGGALAGASLALPGALREALAQTPLTMGVIYVGPRSDFGYNQAQAQAAAAVKKLPGVKVVEEENVPETAAVQKTMEAMINQDKAGADLRHQLRLLRPAHAEDGREVPERALRPLRRHVDRRQAPEERSQLLRLHRRMPVPGGHRRRLHQQDQEAGLHRRQADPAGAAQHQRLRARREERRPEHHHARHLHRRMVDAGQGGRGRQQPDRPGRGRAHLPRRQPEGGGRDGREARHLQQRLPRQPGRAGAQGLPDRRRMGLEHALCRLHQGRADRRADAQPAARRPEGRLREDVALRRRRCRPRPRPRPMPSRPRC